MKNRRLTYIVRLTLAAAALLWAGEAAAQRHPERRHIREGNRQYESGRYEAAEERQRNALENNPASFEASFNLFDALYKQGRYEEAVGLLEQTAQNPLLTPDQKAKVFHNLGNGMFSMQKLQEAADYYKRSLRENPADLETKYNLAYVQKLLEEQNKDDNQENENGGQEGQNQDGQNQDRSDNPEDNRDEQQEGEQNEQGGEQERPDDSGDGQQENPPSKPDSRSAEGGIKREDAQSILDAMQQQEDKTREKVNEQRAKVVGRSGKNW